jgi:ABC-type polysaccharide/polyol phosphate transport system ATPase subunit
MSQARTSAKIVRRTTAAADVYVKLETASVKYKLLTERERTLKGRIFGALQRTPEAKSEFWALRDINFEAHQGEIVGIIGPNGSGKSTLLRVIARVLYPTQGRVTSQGEIRPLLDISSTMNGNLTGRQNAYLYAALYRIPQDKMKEMIPAIRDFAELGPFFDVPVRTYSSGMLARLSFALATQFRPDILLIDEVLAVGDECFQRKSYFRMMRLIERGSLAMIVSHNLSFVEQVCNRAIFLSEGRLIADGRPAEVVSRYRKSIR